MGLDGVATEERPDTVCEGDAPRPRRGRAVALFALAIAVPLTWSSVARHDTRRSDGDTVFAQMDETGGLPAGVEVAVGQIVGPVSWTPLSTVIAVDDVLYTAASPPGVGDSPVMTRGAVLTRGLLRANGFTDDQIDAVADASIVVVPAPGVDDATARAAGVSLASRTVAPDDVVVAHVDPRGRAVAVDFYVSAALADAIDANVGEQELVGTASHLITDDERRSLDALRPAGVSVAHGSAHTTPIVPLVVVYALLGVFASWPQLRMTGATGRHTFAWVTPLAAGIVACLPALTVAAVVLDRRDGSFGFDWRLLVLLVVVPAVVVLASEATVASRAQRVGALRR